MQGMIFFSFFAAIGLIFISIAILCLVRSTIKSLFQLAKRVLTT